MTIFTMKKLYTELTRKNHKYCKWNFDYILRFLRQCRKPLRIENKYKNIMNTIEVRYTLYNLLLNIFILTHKKIMLIIITLVYKVFLPEYLNIIIK